MDRRWRDADRLGPTDGSLADVVEAMALVYEPVLGLRTVVLVARRCQRELEISGASHQRLEPMVRERLHSLAEAKK